MGNSSDSTETSLQDLSTINIVLSNEDILIKSLHLKGYIAKRFTDEFPEKGWTKRGVNGVNKLFKKLRDTGKVDRWSGSDRPCSART